MVNTENPRAFPNPGHNHVGCLAQTLERAEAAFMAKGMRLTDLRRRVFEEIAGSHHAVGAYDVLARIGSKGTRLAPISVYRAIEALMEAGVVHRLESRNAYFACHATHAPERQQLVLACGQCGTVAEVSGDAVFEAISRLSAASSFAPRTMVVEVAGLCGHCARAR